MSWLSNIVGKAPIIGSAINSVAHNVVDPLARAAVSKIPGGSLALGAGDLIGKMIPGGPGSGGPSLQGLGDFLGGNGGKNLLGLAQGVNAAMLQHKSNGLANNALGSVQSDYDSRAPLRQAGQAAMLHPEAGLQARIAALPQGANPYAHPATPQVAPLPKGVA